SEPEAVDWIVFAAQQLVLGPILGIAAGTIGGVLLMRAQNRGLTSATFEGIGAISLAGMAYLGASEIGGNGFIAAFVAGLCFGNTVKGRCKFVYEFTESEGQLLTWGAFFLLGLAMVPEAIEHLDVPMLAIILISLFIVRPLAIWLSLTGTDASPATRLFFGWFGPRGLATALFALVVVQSISGEFGEKVLFLAVNAVWISALLHGLSALPGSKYYAARIAKMGDCAETQPVDD
ncbi:MAG: sodium:proton antiporter, partial [Rhizobiales bacterium]|nr:sodium:proton antiporter [Hyphomicrobiales bacterium]